MKKKLAFSAVMLSLLATNQVAASVPSVKIIGGDPTDITDYGWLGSLHYIGPDGQFTEQSQHLCAGMQITDRWVLSAAHCIEGYGLMPDEVAVAIGVERQDDINTGNLRLISQVIVHPDYDDVTSDHDIVLLQLAEPNPLDDYPLLASTVQTDALNHNEVMTVIGWGDTEDEIGPVNQLREASVDYVGPTQCDDLFRGTGINITDNMICAGGNYSPDTCFGDSGGPLLDNDAVLHGITSWGIACAGEYPSGYTKVANYHDWIEQTTAGLSASSPTYFGLIPLGDGATTTIMISNHSSVSDVTVGAISLAGNSYSLATDDCSNQIIPAQSQCALEVVFEAQSVNSTAGVINVPASTGATALAPLEIELEADVAGAVSFSEVALPAEVSAFSYGQISFSEQDGRLVASLSDALQSSTDLLFQADQDGNLSFVVNLSDEETQSLWVSELNDEVLATYYTGIEDASFNYHLAAGDVLHIEYSVLTVGTATLSDIRFEADQSSSSSGSSSSSSSSGGGGTLNWFALGPLMLLALFRRQRFTG